VTVRVIATTRRVEGLCTVGGAPARTYSHPNPRQEHGLIVSPRRVCNPSVFYGTQSINPLFMTRGTKPSTCRLYESFSRHSQASSFKS
jgi:hypothetical protein